MTLRADNRFVEDEGRHEAVEYYANFLRTRNGQKVLFFITKATRLFTIGQLCLSECLFVRLTSMLFTSLKVAVSRQESNDSLTCSDSVRFFIGR